MDGHGRRRPARASGELERRRNKSEMMVRVIVAVIGALLVVAGPPSVRANKHQEQQQQHQQVPSRAAPSLRHQQQQQQQQNQSQQEHHRLVLLMPATPPTPITTTTTTSAAPLGNHKITSASAREKTRATGSGEPMGSASEMERGGLAASATSRQVSFAASGEQKQGPQQNRWTQFGARLRPLPTSVVASVNPQPVSDHAESASNPNALTAYHHLGSRTSPQQVFVRPSGKQVARSLPPLANMDANSDSDSDPDPDSDSDETDGGGENGPTQDGAALLYKMMQQQGFLGAHQPQYHNQAQLQSNSIDPKSQQQLLNDDNRRAFRLLKSYSHIHQVDDSDDQIRGSGWRPTLAQSSSNKWSQQQQQQQQRPANRRQQPTANEAQHRPAYQPQQDRNSGDQNQDNQEVNASPAQEEDEFECPNNGIFADEPSGCQYYHVCQSGAQVQQKFQCPMGTLFNNVILTCDFAHNVQCSKQARQQREQQHQQRRQLEAPRVVAQQPPTRPWQRPQQRLSGSEPIGSTSYQVQQRPRPPPGPRPLRIGAGAAFTSGNNQLDDIANDEDEQDNGADQQQDSGDGDAPAPLIPARLPYNPPPRPAEPIQRNYQHQQQQSSRQYLMSPFADYSDGSGSSTATSSVSAPVHAGPPTSGLLPTPMSVASSTSPSAPITTTTTPASSFNLLIDHQVAKVSSPVVAKPALSETAPRQQLQSQQKRPSLPPRELQAKPKVDSINQVIKLRYESKRQQQPQQQVSGLQKSSLYQQTGSYPVSSSSQQRPYQQHTMAMQQQPQRPTLVDLTNSQQGPSVASNALQNDGLLLLLRHSGASGSYQAQASSNGGQAYALDPQLVRPNSIDAHLFPNVQSALGHSARVAASSQPTPVRLAPPSQSPLATQTSKQSQRVPSNLPPMEPPKPQEPISSGKGKGRGHHKAASKEELQFQAAASAPARHARTVAPPVPEKQSATKSSTLATGSSTAKPTTTTTTPTAVDAKPTKRATLGLKRTVKRVKLVEKPAQKKANSTSKSTPASPSPKASNRQQQVRSNSR